MLEWVANLLNNIIADGWGKVLRDAFFFFFFFFSNILLARVEHCPVKILLSCVSCCHGGLWSLFELFSGVDLEQGGIMTLVPFPCSLGV